MTLKAVASGLWQVTGSASVLAELRAGMGGAFNTNVTQNISFTTSGLPIYAVRDTLSTVSASATQTLTAIWNKPGSGTSTATTTYGKQWYRYIGTPQTMRQANTTNPDWNGVLRAVADNAAVNSPSFAQDAIEFMVDAAAFEVQIKTVTNSNIRVLINDKVAFDNIVDTVSGYPSGGTFTYLKFAFANRATVRVRLEGGGFFTFYGASLGNATEQVYLPSARSAPLLLSAGNSFSIAAGLTSTDISYGAIAGKLLGFEPVVRGSGSTGYTTFGTTGKMRHLERYAPPDATFVMNNTIAGTNGTFSITWGGVTTAAITWNASTATLFANIQSALNTAFGTDAFSRQIAQIYSIGCGGDVTAPGLLNFVLSHRTLLSTQQPSTAVLSGDLTGAMTVQRQYLGDINEVAPRDANGAILPFVILLEGGYNDTAASAGTIQSLAAECWSRIMLKWPTALLIVMGPPCGTQSVGGGSYVVVDNALWAQAQITLPKINGYIPYISNFLTSYQGITQDQWNSGTGKVGTTTGTGTNDYNTQSDGTHWTFSGHQSGGIRTAAIIARFLGLAL